jgi:hypothetical protein
MAELVSMWPTAGGQYHWTYMLAPEEWKIPLSYVTGWYVYLLNSPRHMRSGSEAISNLKILQAIRYRMASRRSFGRLSFCHHAPGPGHQQSTILLSSGLAWHSLSLRHHGDVLFVQHVSIKTACSSRIGRIGSSHYAFFRGTYCRDSHVT